jgi:hypothetical protein
MSPPVTEEAVSQWLLRLRREVQDLIHTPGLAVSVRAALWLVADSLEAAYVACLTVGTLTTFGRRMADARAVLWGEATYARGVATLSPARHQAMVLSVLESFGPRHETAASNDDKRRAVVEATDEIEYLVGLPTPVRKKLKLVKRPKFELNNALVRDVVREVLARRREEPPSERTGKRTKYHSLLDLFEVLAMPLGTGDEKSLYSMMSRLNSSRPRLDFRSNMRVAISIAENGEVTFERPTDLHPDEVVSSEKFL